MTIVLIKGLLLILTVALALGILDYFLTSLMWTPCFPIGLPLHRRCISIDNSKINFKNTGNIECEEGVFKFKNGKYIFFRSKRFVFKPGRFRAAYYLKVKGRIEDGRIKMKAYIPLGQALFLGAVNFALLGVIILGVSKSSLALIGVGSFLLIGGIALSGSSYFCQEDRLDSMTEELKELITAPNNG